MMRWTVYVLEDPRVRAVRYVGVTTRAVATRLSEHVYAGRRERNHRGCWLRSLLRAGVRPMMRAVETGHGDGWREAERAWIARYRADGADLVNATEGGEGLPGYRWTPAQRAAQSARMLGRTFGPRSPEARARMSAAGLASWLRRAAEGSLPVRGPRTPETCAAMSAALTGRKLSEEHRARIAAGNRDPSAETRQKLAAAVQARPEAQRRAFANCNKGRVFPAEHRQKLAAAARARWDRVRAQKDVDHR